MAIIEIYGNHICPYCKDAKDLLRDKGYAFTEYNTRVGNNFQIMKRRTGGKNTIPQIFLYEEETDKSVYIGGFSELDRLDKSGKLVPLLQNMRIHPRPRQSPGQTQQQRRTLAALQELFDLV